MIIISLISYLQAVYTQYPQLHSLCWFLSQDCPGFLQVLLQVCHHMGDTGAGTQQYW